MEGRMNWKIERWNGCVDRKMDGWKAECHVEGLWMEPLGSF